MADDSTDPQSEAHSRKAKVAFPIGPALGSVLAAGILATWGSAAVLPGMLNPEQAGQAALGAWLAGAVVIFLTANGLVPFRFYAWAELNILIAIWGVVTAARLLGSLAGLAVLVWAMGFPAETAALSMGIVYLLTLLVEVAWVGRFFWQRDGHGSPASPPAKAADGPTQESDV